jgi:ABC-type dipeptide/oligopeptide/nickel transport system ATPase subunit
MFRVSGIINDGSDSIRVGSMLQVVRDGNDLNLYDNASRKVGFVGNTTALVAAKTNSADWLINLLDQGKAKGKEVKEIWGACVSSSPYYAAGNSNVAKKRFVLDLFFVQAHGSAAAGGDPTVKFWVGGVNARNGEKKGLVAQLQKANDDGAPAEIELAVKATGDSGVYSYRVYTPNEGTNPAGEVLCEDPNAAKRLEAWFKTHSELAVKTTGKLITDATPKVTVNGKEIGGTKVGGTGYEIAATFEEVSEDEFDAAIDDAIRRGAGQDKDIREKVKYLIAEGVAKPTINLLLKKMKPVSWSDTQKPARLYSSKSEILGDALAFSLMGEHIRLIGDKGSGKNTLIQTICWLRNQPMCRIQGNIQMDKMDLLGSYQLAEGKTEFVLSDVMKALKAGKTVVIDEANLIRPDVLGLMHSATDEARSVLIPGYGLLRLGADAQVVYTMNEGYQGTSDMNEATVDRTPTFELGQEVSLSTLLAGYPAKAVKNCQKVSDEIRKGVQEGQLSPDAITIRGYISACEMLDYVPIKRALSYCVAKKIQEASQRAAVEAIIANICG